MTYRDVLREIAYDHYGLVTTADAVAVGVPAVELRKLAARGALERRGHGLYRFLDAPLSPRDEFAEAVLLCGADAYLTHDAVLAFHGLGLVNPRRIRVGTPHRVRTNPPGRVELLRRALPDDAITDYEGVRSAAMVQALVDCVGMVMPERLLAASREAHQRGLLSDREYRLVRPKLRRGLEQPDSDRPTAQAGAVA